MAGIFSGRIGMVNVISTRRIFMLVGAAAFIAVFLCYAYFVEPRRLVVNHYEIEVAGWNRAFDGFRVALISDIHAGSNGIDAAKLREIVALTNEQGVDAIFLLGDYVSQDNSNDASEKRNVRMPAAEIADNLSGLRSKYGVFAVLGNHDQWTDPVEIAAEFERVGFNVLNGRVAEIKTNAGDNLRILGLRDHTTIGIWKAYSADARALLAPTEGTGDVIVLEHSPDVLPVITGDLSISKDLKLLFSGHTHGGQVSLPILGPPIVPSFYGQKFARGHVKASGLDVFVTSGIGTSILPFRFMVTPEIAVLTIRAPK